MCAYSIAAMTGALLGRLDRAAALAEEALVLARELGHPGSVAHAHWFACETHFLRREPVLVRELAEGLLRVATDNGSALSAANAKMFLGWSLVAEQSFEDGAARLREGLEDWRRTGSKLNAPYRLARVADGLILAGDWNDTASILTEAAELAEQTGEHWADAELDRLAGLLAITKASPLFDWQKAETHLRKAIAGAAAIGARLIELRAATNLAQLWCERGRGREAHELLSPIYAGFTEGFDTADLKQAALLLAELA